MARVIDRTIQRLELFGRFVDRQKSFVAVITIFVARIARLVPGVIIRDGRIDALLIGDGADEAHDKRIDAAVALADDFDAPQRPDIARTLTPEWRALGLVAATHSLQQEG